MQKTAQKRSVLNKLREMTDVSGIAAEKFFNPEFQRVMESLREKDDHIRSIISGEVIGTGDPGSDSTSIKDLVKSSKSNINRREYMTAVAELGRVHKKLFEAVQVIQTLNADVDKVHHEFLFKDLDDDRRKQLSDLKTRFANMQMEKTIIVKEAGVMDFFYNIGTKRGRALAAWEKRYPKQIGKLKKDTNVLQSKTEGILAITLSALKEMASARSTRNIDAYIKSAEKITKTYQGYDKLFKDYYNDNIKGFLEKIDIISPTEKVDSKELGKQEIPTDGVSPTIPMTNAPSTIPAGPIEVSPTIPMTGVHQTMPSNSTNTIPAGPPSNMVTQRPDQIITTDPESNQFAETVRVPPPPPAPSGPPNDADPGAFNPSEFKSDQVAQELGWKKSHKNFFSSLESMANESPILVARYIAKYAKSIQNTDLETSIQLFKIVNSLNKGM